MEKKKSQKRLYEARLQRGRSNPEWSGFFEGVGKLNGKSPDYQGINNVAIIGTHHDQITVESIISGEMNDESDLSVVEITGATLKGSHLAYTDLINDYFLPYGDYPGLAEK